MGAKRTLLIDEYYSYGMKLKSDTAKMGERSGRNLAKMVGSLEVIDLNGCGHWKYTETTDEETHAETALKRAVIAYSAGEAKLQHAKINVYMTSSPCVQCTNSLYDTYEALKKAICPNGTLFMAFAFAQYYSRNRVNSNHPNVWPDDQSAIGAYQRFVQYNRSAQKPDRLGLNALDHANQTRNIFKFLLVQV